jgi:hypothetical protein
MKRFSKTVVRTLGFACCWLAVSSAEAATPRAYVSVNGNDANTCNVPATPCRTYTGAISQVTAGGTVIVLDSGTFGGGTISQSVTINAPSGIVALAATAITVNPGAGNKVVLRGLTFQAATPGFGTAITHQSGRLFVENTVVDGWYEGLVVAPGAEELFVKASIFRNQDDVGLLVAPDNTALLTVEDSFFERNNSGIFAQGGHGLVSQSVISSNSYAGLVTQGGGWLTLLRCEMVGNANIGAYADGAGTVLRVSASTITGSSTGLTNGGSGAVVESFGNNAIRGNTTNTFGTITTVTLQ